MGGQFLIVTSWFLLVTVVSPLRLPILKRGFVRPSRTLAKTAGTAAATMEPRPEPLLDTAQETSGSTFLCFVGETCRSSGPVSCSDSSILHDFFSRGEHRNLLLSEKGNVRTNGNLVEVDCFVGFRRGLQICSTTIIDAQVQPASRDEDLPSYCFELIDSKLSASGVKPLVWLFERLVASETKTIATKSRTMVTCEAISAEEVAFKTNATIEVSINVPDYLVRFASSRTIEAQGNQAMQRFLEREVEPSLHRFRNAYCDFAALEKAVEEPLLAANMVNV
mmetsp:Transcript_50923/g.76134  ORF Transcript_50923/g.76134 Transcript_50923/m.76134 type:complete len:279 (-) Transcript_50923:324-1160(-)|eukprot:CAMPEP_0194051996 /NCGR_PEP_ID=MMETSP0009_2-20130614/43452_1 /TAXON_ID=210454 /ORGANISM="Grammatophora oceanica, Strain CCMP 410" /LENGTH=278 /DNA_ID=CAMNT_0038699361 /DNA_START=246 /DNA_END=1082 /DNA_ORIENTATION=-